MEYVFFGLLIVIIAFWAFVTFFYSWKRKKLLQSQKTYYEAEIRKCDHGSATERIMKYDKILHHILKDYGYSGSVGDQLKAKPRVISDLDKIWDLHKVRNRIAHDLSSIANDILEQKASEFKKELQRLIQK